MDVFNFEGWLSSVLSIYQGLNCDTRQRVLFSLAACSSSAEIHPFIKKLKKLTTRDFIAQLPAELVDHLLTFLDCSSVLAACGVSTVWLEKLSENKRLWKRMCRLQGIQVLNYRDNLGGSQHLTQDSDSELQHRYQSCTCDMTADSESVCRHRVVIQDTPRAEFMRRLSFLKLFYRNRLTECIQLSGHSERVSAMFYFHGTLATGSDDRTVRLWDTSATDCRYKAVIHVGHSVSALKFDDTYMVIGSFSADLTLWDLGSSEPRRLRRYIGNTAAVFCVDFSVAFDSIFSGTASSVVSHWSLSTGELWRVIETVTIPRSVLCLRIIDADGKPLPDQYVLVASNNLKVSMWVLHASSPSGKPKHLMCRMAYFQKRLRVIPVDESRCLIAEVNESKTLVFEVVQLRWRKRSVGDRAENIPSASGDDFDVSVTIVGEQVFDNHSSDVFILGAGTAFSIILERHTNKLSIARHTGGDDPLGIFVCSLGNPSKQTWLTDCCPVATVCDVHWLEHGFNERLHQTIAAVSLQNNNIALYRRTKVGELIAKDAMFCS